MNAGRTPKISVPRQKAGFTLLELLVVIAIMGLIAGLAFPAIDRSIKTQAIRTSASQIDMIVRRARADAIRQQRTVSVAPFKREDSRRAINLPRGVVTNDVKIEQPSALRFFRDGTSTGGKIELTSGGRKFRIEINAVTGIITSGMT
jgi:general secretion pathway protein H